MEKSKKNNGKSLSSDSNTEAEKRKKLEKQIRQRVACEEKAFRIVEDMLENPISEEFLLQSAFFIQPSHYQDIVEERAIAMMCGYPLCPQSLVSVPKQKYHISTRSNKVYDITARKNFCSNKCFHASEYFEKQISSSPLWTRDEEPPPAIKLLPLDNVRGSAGHEVISGSIAIKKELEDLRRLDKFEDRLKAKHSKKHDPETLNLQALNISDTNSQSDKGNSNNQPQKQLNIDSQSENTSSSQSEGERCENQSEGQPNINSQSEETTNSTSECLVMGENSSPRHILEREANAGMFNISQTDDKISTQEKCEMNTVKNIVMSGDAQSKNSELASDDIKLDMCKNEQLKGTSSSEVGKMDSAGSGSDLASPEDKMKHLMRLLDRRKNLLSQMADIQPKSDDHGTGLLTSQSKSVTQNAGNISGNEDDNKRSQLGSSNASLLVKSQSEIEVHCQSLKVTGIKQVKPETKRKPQIQNPVTPLFMICQSIKDWITKETLHYLVPENDKSEPSEIHEKHKFEEKYQELCRKLDSQDNDLENMLGETSMVETKVAGKPVPDYDKLKEETEEFSQRVSQYFQGKTLPQKRILEKEKGERTHVYLPTVDAYDQMQIRRKIVMDKLNKSMPELLPPLKLSIQDIFSDIKQMLETFSFNSHNILFKPAEWTVVSLILLKMLSRKQIRIAASFLHTSAENYFQILLNGIGETTHSLDLQIDALLNM